MQSTKYWAKLQLGFIDTLSVYAWSVFERYKTLLLRFHHIWQLLILAAH